MRCARLFAVGRGIVAACLLAAAAPAAGQDVYEDSGGPILRATATPWNGAYYAPEQPEAAQAVYHDDIVTGDDAAAEIIRLAQAQQTVPDDGTSIVPTETVEGVFVDGQPYLWGDVYNYCHGCCTHGFYTGAEFTWLSPVSEPKQRVTLTDLITNETTIGEAEHGMDLGVRYWVGLQRCGWGIVIRHWTFENDNVELDPVAPINGEPATVSAYHLEADTIDIELTQRFCFGCWQIDTAFGGRYAELERNGTVVGYGTVGGVDVLGLANGVHDLEGSGFTFAIRGQKDLCCSPCWNWFWSYRGSLLWADSTASVLTDATAIVKPPIGFGVATSRDKAFASKAHSEDVFISEVQVGVQYERCLQCLPSIFFARVAVEYQHWETGDVFAQSNSFAFLAGAPPLFGGRVDASAVAHDGNLDLIGVNFGIGLTY